MARTESWIKIVKAIFSNAKWIMLGLLLLNLFVFGYWEQLSEYGLGGEETLWGLVMLVVLILLFVFDKAWKRLVDRICNSL